MKKRTWRPNYPQAFSGSIREGQGFASRRKLKIQQHYKKLQWKKKKAQTSQESQFTDQYPDHLKHLYLAEEERLRKQLKKVTQPLSEEKVDQPLPEKEHSIDQTLSEDQCSVHQPQSEQCSKTEKYVFSFEVFYFIFKCKSYFMKGIIGQFTQEFGLFLFNTCRSCGVSR